MKKVMVLLSTVAFVAVISLASANAQDDPKKKSTETKAKTEQCSKAKSKCCPKSCDKKAKETEETKTTEKKKEKK